MNRSTRPFSRRRVHSNSAKSGRGFPGERRPNFERAAANTLRKALGHKTADHRHNLHISNSLMHEHAPDTARIIERTLKNGIINSDVLHSFRDDYRTVVPSKARRAPALLHHDDPEPEVWIAHDSDIDYVIQRQHRGVQCARSPMARQPRSTPPRSGVNC